MTGYDAGSPSNSSRFHRCVWYLTEWLCGPIFVPNFVMIHMIYFTGWQRPSAAYNGSVGNGGYYLLFSN